MQSAPGACSYHIHEEVSIQILLLEYNKFGIFFHIINGPKPNGPVTYRAGPHDPGAYGPGPHDPGAYDPGPHDPGAYGPGSYVAGS